MVKGVKRNIIEVNNTGSDCFERIVFYISPDFPLGNRNVADLAAAELKRIVNGTNDYKRSVRYRIKEKKRKKRLLLALGAALIVFAVIMLKIIF